MDAHTILAATLVFNAVLGFGYRVYRLTEGGPFADVVGQALLGLMLIANAAGVAAGAGWTRWLAFGYALVFALLVMPLWVLAVLIPLRPRAPDYAFTAAYWVALFVIAGTALGA